MWMTPDKLARTLKPGKLTLLKYKVLGWPGPWRWMQKPKKAVLIQSRVLAAPKGITLDIEHSILCRTNTDGTRVWIIPPEGLQPLRIQSNSSNGIVERSGARLTLLEGTQAQISNGSFSRGNTGFCGLAVNVLPKIVHGSFNLLIGATSSDMKLTSAETQTNISLSCRAMVPNGGALVVSGNGAGNDGSGTNYCLIISAVAVDSKGNPIKLPVGD
jgi:hypothetical protein